jgi:hypothetical protein
VQRVRSVDFLPRTHGIGNIPVIAKHRPDDVNAWYEVNCGRTRRRPASSEGRMSAAHPCELTPVMVGRQPKRTSSLSSPSVDVPGSGVSLVPLAARQSVWGVARAACRAAATPFGVAIVKSGVDSASFPAAGACVENQGHSPPVCVASSTWPVSSRGTVLLPPSIEASLVRRAGSRGGHLMRISRNDT